MNLREAANLASEFELSVELAHEFCAKEDISLSDFCNKLATFTAEQFIENQSTYEFGDSVLNCLSGIMIDALVNSKIEQLPEPAWEIYLAFDRGEYSNSRIDNPDEDMAEKYTRPKLANILNQAPRNAHNK